MLDDQGFVAEASAAAFFIVRNDELITPPNDNSLESITQKTVLCIAADMNLKVKMRRITREEVYIADEVFLAGTAMEITGVDSVDMRTISEDRKIGKITREIQKRYFDIVFGKDKNYIDNLTFIK